MTQKTTSARSQLLWGLVILLAASLTLTACGGAGRRGGGGPQMMRIQGKVKQVQREITAWQKEGRDPSAAAAEMQQAKPLLQQKQYAAAEGHVDRALAILRDEPVPAAPTTVAKTGSRPATRTAPSSSSSRSSGAAAKFGRVQVRNEPTPNGAYDPALAYNEDGSVGWLTYTAVDGAQPSKAHYLHTHVAKTTDHGRTWRYANTVNESHRGAATWKGDSLDGYWHYEVSTMYHDPTDRGREWKMLSFRIFHADRKGRMPQLSWIVYKYASDPAGQWSDEVSLISSGKMPPPPYDTQKFKLGELHRDLKRSGIFSEPGAVVVDGVTYLSLTGLGRGGADKIFLLRSRDHLQSLEYVGTLVDRDDAKKLGDTALDGSALFQKDGNVYMLACAIKSKSRPDLQNNGTYLFAIDDITKAKVRRDSSGAPDVLMRIMPQDLDSGSHGGGQGDYDQYNTGGGIVVPQINLGAMPEWAQVFNTELVPE